MASPIKRFIQTLGVKINSLIFQRVVILLIVAIIGSFGLINQSVLKIKALNIFLPSPAQLKTFAHEPTKLDRETLKNIRIYYEAACDYVAHDPEAPAPCGIVAYAHYYLGQEQKAIRHYNNVIKQNGRFFWFYYNLASIYYNQGRYKEAAANFNLALDTSPLDSMNFLLLTKTYRDVSKYLGIFPSDYGQSLHDGYIQAHKWYQLSSLLSHNPDLKANQQRIKLQLY